MLALHTAIGVVQIILHALSFVIVVQAILSILIAFNVVNRYNQFVSGLDSGLDQLTRPLYRPFRRLLPATGQVDLAPFLALILIQILLYVLGNADVAVLTHGAGGMIAALLLAAAAPAWVIEDNVPADTAR